MNQTPAPYVFLIDDDIDISDAIKAILMEEGHHVECAHDGIEALELLRTFTTLPALILLDIMMPKMNGYEFRKEQMKDAKLSSIPTVVFTAAGRFEINNSYKFTATLKKPLDLDRLMALVKNYLS